MTEFKDREEYENWKARRLRELQDMQEESAISSVKPDGGEGTGAKEKGGKGDLSDPGELFRRAWEIYRRRAGVLMALYIISFLFLMVAFGLCLGTGYLLSLVLHWGRKVLPVSGAVTGLIVGSIFFTWGLAAVTYAAADEALGIRDALRRGGAAIWSFMWLISLLGYIIPGGFLLFIIPGVIFSVWFAFAQFIFVTEGGKGMDCLLKSKEYVRGLWLEVFLRLFLVWIVSVVIGSVPILGPILSLLFVPYLLIFVWLLYKEVKALKVDVAYSTATAEKVKWIGAATLGYLALPLFVFCLLGASIMAFPFAFLKGCLISMGL
jgi:hypothetical protein